MLKSLDVIGLRHVSFKKSNIVLQQFLETGVLEGSSLIHDINHIVLFYPLLFFQDQALYWYAAEPELFQAKTPSFRSTTQDLFYETPDAGSVRGLMLGLQTSRVDYETPDAASVDEFMSNWFKACVKQKNRTISL